MGVRVDDLPDRQAGAGVHLTVVAVGQDGDPVRVELAVDERTHDEALRPIGDILVVAGRLDHLVSLLVEDEHAAVDGHQQGVARAGAQERLGLETIDVDDLPTDQDVPVAAIRRLPDRLRVGADDPGLGEEVPEPPVELEVDDRLVVDDDGREHVVAVLAGGDEPEVDPTVDDPLGRELGRVAADLPQELVERLAIARLHEGGRERLVGGHEDDRLAILAEDGVGLPDELVALGDLHARDGGQEDLTGLRVDGADGDSVGPVELDRLPHRLLVGEADDAGVAIADEGGGREVGGGLEEDAHNGLLIDMGTKARC